MVILDAATELNDLRIPPGNRLEALKRNRKGQHSIRINDQWRICFKWRDSDAYDVEITDYLRSLFKKVDVVHHCILRGFLDDSYPGSVSTLACVREL